MPARKPKKAEPPIANPYRDRVLAFVDLLGWSSLVSASRDTPEVLRALRNSMSWMLRVRNTAEKFRDEFRRAPSSNAHLLQQVGQFSDTVVISCRPTPEATHHLIYTVQQFCNRVLLSDPPIFTRGAIVRGQLLHDGNVIFGPALIDAYRLEQSEAKAPRVLVSDEVCRLLAFEPSKADWPDRIPIARDRDGKLFIDFLQEAGNTIHFWTSTLRAWVLQKNRADRCRPPGPERESILRKNRWMLDYIRDSGKRAIESHRIARRAG